MSYPFDQFAAVAGANRQLALKCAEIMREAGQRQAAIASRTFELLSAQSAEKAGAVPLPNCASAQYRRLFRDVAGNQPERSGVRPGHEGRARRLAGRGW